MSLFSKWFGSKERRILILGLDGAGNFFFVQTAINLFSLKFSKIIKLHNFKHEIKKKKLKFSKSN